MGGPSGTRPFRYPQTAQPENGMGMDKRRRGERRGTDSDEHYRLLIDAVAEYALFLLGPEGNVISWGPGAEQIMGYRAEEIVGKHFSCFYPVKERDRGKPGKDLKLAAAKGRVQEEGSWVRKDDSQFRTNVVTVALRDDSGQLQGFAIAARDVTERRQMEEALREGTHQLGERVKKLNCLFGISELNQTPGISLEQILRGTVGLVPPAWQYPDITCARITLGDQEFKTEKFRETPWRQVSDIRVRGERVGSVEVCYLEERPEAYEGPFLQEERSLIDAIAERLGRTVQRDRAEEALRERTQQLLEVPEISLEELLQRTADLIPPSWQYPDVTCARITLGDQDFRTEKFRETPWRQVSDIRVRGERVGGVEVCYLEERPESNEGPFLREERSLLEAIAERLGRIVERKWAEEAVRTERQRLEALMATSPVGIFVVDADGGVLLANAEMERIVGFSYRPDDRLERYEQAAVYRQASGHPYAVEELPLQRALYRGEAVRAEEVTFDLPDGRVVPTLINTTPIYSTEGEIAGAIATIQDITPLQEVERLRSEFLGVVSHELKTPLTAIKGSAAMALGRQGSLDAARARGFFQIIDEQADRLAGLVDNLLDMTRIEAGSLSVSPEPTDLKAVLEEATATFARGGDSHEVQIQVPEDLPAVNADRGRVAQVLSNLLSNAAKFSPQAEQISITVEPGPLHVTVHVRDRGRGIPAEKLPHLFKKFSQIHEEQARGLGGSGLGLAICKGIIEAHGGRIWAESEGLGRGSTFSFTLPMASDASVASTLEAGWEKMDGGRVSRAGERPRILALDDEPQVLRYLRRALHEAGYEAVVTTDPREVPRLVELEEPELFLLDLMLPGISGFEVLERVREISDVPVIVITASPKEEDSVRALKMGADDYIRKPFSPSELVARIEAALRRRLPSDAAESRAPFVLDDLTINFVERRVTVGGRAISLSATQYKLLYELAIHAGRVLTHDQILQRVWGAAYSGETGLLRSFIRDLRQKLGDDARDPRYISTEPRVGYRMPKPQS